MNVYYFVYILECADGYFYTGFTSNIHKRFEQHQHGHFKSCFTFKRRPVELVFTGEFTDPYVGIEWEKRIKGWSRAKKRALIDGEWELLQDLARCRNITSHEFFES